MNSTVQKSIQCSPAEIIFGKKLHKERFYQNFQNIDEPVKYIEKINKLQKEKQEIIKFRNQINNYENEKRTHRSFNIGDKVLVKIDIRNKQDNRYSGPHTIQNKLHDNSYQLENKFGKSFIRNVEWLKPYKSRGM